MTGWDDEAILDWPYAKFAEWWAYFQEEPFGPVQEDLRAGNIASLIYNSNRGKDAPALRPEDWYPSLGPPPEVKAEQDRNQERAKMLWWVAQQNAMAAAAKRLQRNGHQPAITPA